jgi:predicted DNA-binding transcriptional regulator AlpA
MSNQTLETLLDEKELSRLLRVSIGTLRFWRTIERGPRYRKVGQLVRYAPSDVHDWLSRRPTGGEVASEAEVAG